MELQIYQDKAVHLHLAAEKLQKHPRFDQEFLALMALYANFSFRLQTQNLNQSVKQA